VVQVGVGVDDGGDGPVAPMPPVERDSRGCDLPGDQRVDDDDPVVAFDQRHVGHLETADLVDPVGHLIQAVLGGELGLPPQTGVNRVRAVAVQESPGVHVPDRPAVGRPDDHRLQRADETTVSIGEISTVAEVGSNRPGPPSLLRHLTPPNGKKDESGNLSKTDQV